MADVELNVDPLRRGPFAGAPRVSQIGGFPYGTIDVDTSSERRGLFYGDAVLPQFSLGTRVPTTGQVYSLGYGPLSISHSVTVVNSGNVKAFAPIFMGVGRFTSSGTLSAAAFVSDSGLAPYGYGKWGLAYKDASYNVNSAGQTKYPGYAGVWPGLVYVWRPGVGAVGFSFSTFSALALLYAPPVYTIGYWQQWWAAAAYWMCTSGGGIKNVESTHCSAIDFEVGDLLCVEYFALAFFTPQSSTASVGACTLQGTVQIGGGTNRSPVSSGDVMSQVSSGATQNTQVPCHNTVAPSFGLPAKVLPPQVSVGF